MSIRLKHVRRKSQRRALIHTLLASTLALASLPALAQEIVPPERKITWLAGVDGGIPTVPVEANVLDFGAVADGLTDDAQAFKDAIAALPPQGGAVLIPAGTYLLRSTIKLDDGTVLRGQGATKTFLRFDLGGSDSSGLEAVTYERGTWVNIQSGHDKGSTTLTVADASEFVVPTFAEIQQTNDPDIMYTESYWDAYWAKDSVGEIVRVIGKSGNQLTLADPLHFSYDPNMNPLVRPQGFVERAGIEDLHIERLDEGRGHNVRFQNAAWVWMRGVESAFTVLSHVDISTVYGCEVRDSYMHHSHGSDGGGGPAYGTNLGRHTTNCLIENNIFVNLRHAILAQIGANGNVFAYNYSREPLLADGLWSLPDISLHGHYPFYNLIEGNIVQETAAADYWGPVGPGNTFLRNCVQLEGLWIDDESHDQNVVGNTLTGVGKNYILIDASVEGTLKHGNWTGGAIQWDPGIPNHTIPDSYYLMARPSFYGTDDWPSIGGDLGPACTNPAFKRWENHEETPGVNSSPYTPSNPSPANGSSENSVETVLSWLGGDPNGNPVTYDVFLAPNDDTPEIQVCSAITSTSCDPPGDLLNSTLYYWKVIAKDDRGAESTSVTWSISTITNDDVDPDEVIFDGGFE